MTTQPTAYQSTLLIKLHDGYTISAYKGSTGQGVAYLNHPKNIEHARPVSISTLISMVDKGLLRERVIKGSCIDRVVWELIK